MAENTRRIAALIAAEIAARPEQAQAAIALIDEGSTVPFIARYRKEATGALDDGQLRTLAERLVYLREMESRRAAILESIRGQGKLTEPLEAQLTKAATKAELEDLYLPYKPKRRTKADIARERGLQRGGLAVGLSRPGSDADDEEAGEDDDDRRGQVHGTRPAPQRVDGPAHGRAADGRDLPERRVPGDRVGEVLARDERRQERRARGAVEGAAGADHREQRQDGVEARRRGPGQEVERDRGASEDRVARAVYEEGKIFCPDALWGAAR